MINLIEKLYLILLNYRGSSILVVKRTYRKKQSKEIGIAKYNHEIIGILLFALGVLVFLSLYIKNSIGLFGIIIKDLFFGLLGLPSFVLPFIIIIYAVFIMFRKDGKIFKLKVLYTVILLDIVSFNYSNRIIMMLKTMKVIPLL